VVGVSIGDIPLPGELPTSFVGEPYRRSFAVRLEQRRELFQKLQKVKKMDSVILCMVFRITSTCSIVVYLQHECMSLSR
jgi:hypothetical protein